MIHLISLISLPLKSTQEDLWLYAGAPLLSWYLAKKVSWPMKKDQGSESKATLIFHQIELTYFLVKACEMPRSEQDQLFWFGSYLGS